jgi:hypothetical protein
MPASYQLSIGELASLARTLSICQLIPSRSPNTRARDAGIHI